MALPMLTEDQMARLVREAALAYYSPDELAVQLGLEPAVVRRLMNHPDVAPTVAKLKRELTESGERFVLAAKQAATELLPEILAIAVDENQSTPDRLKAMEQIAKWSGLSKPEDDKGPVQIVINGVDNLRALRESAPWASREIHDTPSMQAPTTFRPLVVEVDGDLETEPPHDDGQRRTILMYFRPTRDFPAEVGGRRTNYVKGLLYTVRPGDADLQRLVPEWRDAGLVAVTEARPAASGALTTGA
jgi:hypothetical protein